jgi:hypothetical protein
MGKNVDDFFDDTESVKSFRFRTFWFNKKKQKHSTPKYSPYKILSKFELEHFFVFELSSVRRAICLHQWDRYGTS